MTRIAIDAMGGDHAPHEIVAGAVWAAKEYGVAIELVGKQDRIEQELDKISHEGFMTDYGKGGAAKYRVKIDTSKLDIKITHASEVIEMGEAPGQAMMPLLRQVLPGLQWLQAYLVWEEYRELTDLLLLLLYLQLRNLLLL